MTDYIKIDWADVKAGDVLLHENGDRITVNAHNIPIMGKVAIHRSLQIDPGELEHNGFIPHRKVEPLPTEPGAYLDRNGTFWILDSYTGDGKPWIGQGDTGWRTPEEAGYSAPFTRLVPMPTEGRVLNAIYRGMLGAPVSGAYLERAAQEIVTTLNKERTSD